ncbi:DUF2125 domain-containing protein [Falsigemmobacter faecalis]|uniref:DUF2125 domain-containing protein n=1 Tax=Falsigemmobacter faecalis TaxID=2488730 RepID=A0A3P3D750_9RHOB|nr:DUF2125 domain-containing protein [Falsigemmobacter faecalis]RRH70210.1 hypothetical protein EG244_17110 [Falsigemmobacter faecalis]
MITRSLQTVPLLAALLCPGNAAFAGLTAEGLWHDWKASAERAGLTLQAEGHHLKDGALQLTGLSLGVSNGARLQLSQIELTSKPDGSVEIRPGTLSLRGLDSLDAALPQLNHSGLSVTATEPAAGGIRYSYQAAEFSLSYDVTIGPADTGRAAQSRVALTGLRGSFSDRPGALHHYALDLKASRFLSEMRLTGAGTKATTPPLSRSDTEGLALRGELILPQSVLPGSIVDAASFRAALMAGLSVSFDAAQGITLGEGRDDAFPLPYAMALRSEPASGRIALSKAALSLSVESAALDFHITTPLGPAPMDVSFGGARFALTLPATARDTAAPYGLKIGVQDLSMSETAWAVFDSGRVLLRDPLQLDLDLNGKMRFDLATATSGQAEAGDPDDFIRPETLTLRKALLSVAGARFEAEGAFRFDAAARTLSPVGQAHIAMSGVERLIRALTTLGVLAQENSGIATGMLRSFTKPGPGVDSWISAIKTLPDGSVTLNGERMR